MPPVEAEQPRHRYIRPGERRSVRGTLLAGFLVLLVVSGAVATVILALEKLQEQPQAKSEKPSEPVPPTAPATVEPQPKPPAPVSQPKPSVSQPKPPPPIGPEPPGPALVALPVSPRTFSLRAPAARLELTQRPNGAVFQIETPFDKVKRIFPPPSRATHDTIVVWQSNPGFNGRGERLTVDSYSGMIGARTGRFEYDGDGKDVKCDVSADGHFFAAVGVDGKVGVWNLVENVQVLEGFDPYADLPEHRKAGLAAVFFAANSGHLVTVSTAGAVHLFEIATRKRLDQFVPPKATAGRVVAGKSVSADESRASIVLVVGGVVYQVVTAAPLKVAWELDLQGEILRPLGVAVFGTPGRVAFAFETETDKQKQQAIVFCLPKGAPTFFLWPDSAGEPTGAAWAGANFAVVPTTRGAVWVEAEPKRFTPLTLGQVPGGKGLHAATEDTHWYLVPHRTDAGKSVLVGLAMPPDDLLDFRADADADRPLPTVHLDDKGLSK